jgi:aldehyde dehydrogenase (NAD+)
MSYIEDGKRESARLALGGKRFGTTGYFVEPTVFGDVTMQMKIAKEEIFGPVACLIRFEDEAEAIAIANNTAVRSPCRASG